jgi:eukaryotic-like serine/threonine-protein kinase
MSSAGDDPRGDRLADLLATYDDALAKGQTPPSTLGSDADLRRRAGEARATLRQLEAIWPRTDQDPTSGGEISGPPSSHEGPRAPGASARLGRFLVLEELGRGGFGVVFRAVDPSLGRDVALKVPRPETLMTPELRSRFLTEARAAARLDHPNIVPIYEAGEIGSISYIASAYCEGPTLAGWLKARPEPAPPRLAARLIATLADAVQHAHDRGILHRDIKPSNILLQSSAKAESNSNEDDFQFIPRVTDFGLAKILDEIGTETGTGLPLGSPSYMSPEQAEGRSSAMGPSTDVYALGAILYELLAGRPPFRGSSILEILDQVRSVEPEPLSRHRSALPRDLETICLRCLRKVSSDRYPTASALADDLRRFLAGEPIRSRADNSWSRVRRWCLQPRRVRDAGFAVMTVSLMMTMVASTGFPALDLGLMHLERPWAMKLHLLRWIFGLYLPTAWVGWKMTQGRSWAPVVGFAFSMTTLILIILVMSGIDLDDLGGGVANDRTARWPSEMAFATLFLIETVASGIAMFVRQAGRVEAKVSTA